MGSCCRGLGWERAGAEGGPGQLPQRTQASRAAREPRARPLWPAQRSARRRRQMPGAAPPRCLCFSHGHCAPRGSAPSGLACLRSLVPHVRVPGWRGPAPRGSWWSLGRQPLPFRESAGKASLTPETSRSGSWGARRMRKGVFCAGSRCRGELRVPKRSRRTRPAPSAWTRATQPDICSQTVGVRPAHQGAHSSHTATESPNGPLTEVRVQPLKIELSLRQK